jgi:hypothetical protein
MSSGGAIGSAIGAGVSAATGAPMGLSMKGGAAAGGYLDAFVKKRKAAAIMPTDVDPLEQLQLDRLNARAQAIRTGTGNRVMGAIQEALATTVSRSFSGGAGGGRGILNDIDQTFNRSIIGVNSANNQMLSTYDTLITGLSSKIADRKFQLDAWRVSKLEADAANAEQSADANLGSFMADIAAQEDAKKSEDEGGLSGMFKKSKSTIGGTTGESSMGAVGKKGVGSAGSSGSAAGAGMSKSSISKGMAAGLM